MKPQEAKTKKRWYYVYFSDDRPSQVFYGNPRTDLKDVLGISGGNLSEQELRTSLNLLDEPCCLCGGVADQKISFGKDFNSYCPKCEFWGEKLEYSNELRQIRVKGEMYFIGNEDDGSYSRGFYGDTFLIERFNGPRIKTTNLWYNGKIPSFLKDRLPDNAEFIKECKNCIVINRGDHEVVRVYKQDYTEQLHKIIHGDPGKNKKNS